MNAFQSEDNGETISSTLSLIKVLFEDLRLGFEIHQQFKKMPQKTLILMKQFFFSDSDFYNTRWVQVWSPIAKERWD
jgi:hypothetical protein